MSEEICVAPLRVVEIDCQTDPRWEALVTSLPQGLIYHHPAWLRVLEESFGYKPVHLACEDADGHLRGVLPLFYMRGLFTGRRFSSLPHTPVGGPLARDDQASTALLHTAVERIREERNAQLQFKMTSNALEADGLISLPWRETYLLELPAQPETLHIGSSRNHSRIKWAVNKAAKLGVQVRQAETERDLRNWYDLYLETMRWFFVPPRPYHFFEVAWRQLWPRGMMRLLLAEHHEAGRAVMLAGSIFLMFGETVFYAFNGRQPDKLAFRPNDAIQWKGIHDACAAGFRYYDFGEVTRDHQSLAEFKSKWGAEPKWLYRYYYPAPRELEIGMLESDSRIAQFAHAAWRQLPLKVTALLGNWAHSHF